MTNRGRVISGLFPAAVLAWIGVAGAQLTPGQKCEKAKNTAAARFAQCLAAQHGREISGRTPDYSGCTGRLSNAFANAEHRAAGAGGACPTTDDQQAIQESVLGAFDPSAAIPKLLAGGTRFVDNGDGTVTDNALGLMWEQKTGTVGTGVDCSTTTCSNPHDVNNEYQWCLDANHDATCDNPGNRADGGAFTDFLAKLNDHGAGCLGGQCDWRLPTFAELNTILLGSAPCTSPCIDQIHFGPTQSYYWSSATESSDLTQAFLVLFNNTGLIYDSADIGTYPKSDSHYVRAVRGGWAE